MDEWELLRRAAGIWNLADSALIGKLSYSDEYMQGYCQGQHAITCIIASSIEEEGRWFA